MYKSKGLDGILYIETEFYLHFVLVFCICPSRQFGWRRRVKTVQRSEQFGTFQSIYLDRIVQKCVQYNFKFLGSILGDLISCTMFKNVENHVLLLLDLIQEKTWIFYATKFLFFYDYLPMLRLI